VKFTLKGYQDEAVLGLTANGATSLVKSKQRVADHGEVFTPPWLVEHVLDLVKHEAERIDSRFLEPACGSGNFLIPVLRRKLATVHAPRRDHHAPRRRSPPLPTPRPHRQAASAHLCDTHLTS
jgi:hypothetical protein